MLRRTLSLVTSLLLLAASWAVPALAQSRRAFVIGINVYDQLGPKKQLEKAVGDARAMAMAFGSMQFAVTKVEDVRRGDFHRQWNEFLKSVQPGDTVALAFSGHGVQVNSVNYLLPRDFPSLRPGDEGLLATEAIALHRLLDDVAERKPRMLLAVIDACRDNPLATTSGATKRSVGGSRGLAQVEPPRGSFVMLSAAPGEQAIDKLSDGDAEPTSIFTRTLIPLLTTPGLPLNQVAVAVRDRVTELAATIRHPQHPAYWDQLTGGAACLNGACRNLEVVASPSPPLATDANSEPRRPSSTMAALPKLSPVPGMILENNVPAAQKMLRPPRLFVASGDQILSGVIAATLRDRMQGIELVRSRGEATVIVDVAGTYAPKQGATCGWEGVQTLRYGMTGSATAEGEVTGGVCLNQIADTSIAERQATQKAAADLARRLTRAIGDAR